VTPTIRWWSFDRKIGPTAPRSTKLRADIDKVELQHLSRSSADPWPLIHDSSQCHRFRTICAPLFAASILVSWSFNEFTPMAPWSRHQHDCVSDCPVARIGWATRAGQESRTSLEMPAGRPQKKNAHSAARTQKPLTPLIRSENRRSVSPP